MAHLMILLISLASLCVQARATSNNPYQSTQTVTDKSKETLDASIKTAFYEVLSKKSGMKISSQQHADHQPASIKTMVERYEYTKTTCNTDEALCYLLTIHFNEETINTYMQNNQIQAWVGERPSTLIWLTEPTVNGRVTIDEYNDTAVHILAQAKNRAMVVLFPTGDITDQQIMPDEPQVTSLEFLQSKYQVEQILYGSINQELPKKVSWHLFGKTQNHEWESRFNNLNEALSGALDHIVNLAKVNHKSTNQNVLEKTTIEIQQINSFEDYTNVSNQLLKNAQINKVSISSIGSNFFVIEVTHNSSTETLLQTLQNATYLQSRIETPSSSKAVSSYQWIPSSNQQ